MAADALAMAVPTMIPMEDEWGGREAREKRRLAQMNYDPMGHTPGRAARTEHDPYAHLN